METWLRTAAAVATLVFGESSASADEPISPSASAALPNGDFAPTAGAAESSDGDRGNVKVHIESPRPVLLFAESEAIAERAAIGVVRSKPQEICPSPCDRVVDGRPGVRFFVTGAPGDDMPRSSSFILGDRESPVQVDVKPGNLRIRDAGISVALVGVAFALGGLVTVGVAGANKDATEATKHREIVTAITLDAVAVIHIAVGVPLGLVGETRIDVHDLARKKVSVPRKPRYWAGEF